MSDWNSQPGTPIVCPSCKTRLRLSMSSENPSVEFACPECEIALVAIWTVTTGVVVSAAEDQVCGETPVHDAAIRLTRKLTAKHRTIAAVITAALGLMLVISLTSTGSTPSSHSIPEGTKVPGIAAAQSHEASDAANKSDADVARTMEQATEPQALVDTGSQITEQTYNDRSDDTEQPDAVSPSPPPPAALIANAARDSVKLVSADGDTSGSDPEASAVAQIAAHVKNESSDGRVLEPLDLQSQQPTAEQKSVRERLGFSIKTFRQTKPVPLHDLIMTVEQMCRVDVDVTAASEKSLSTEVTLSLVDTTPADILSEAGRKTGLRAIVDESSIRMIPEVD